VLGLGAGAPVGGVETVTGTPVRYMNSSKRLVGQLAGRRAGGAMLETCGCG